MNRKLSLIEGTMYAGGRTPVNVVSAVKIKGVIDPESLRLALLKIQRRHFLLNVNVIEDGRGIPHFVRSDPAQEISVRKLERQADEDWQREATAECLKPFDAGNELLIRLVWLQGAETSELMFVCHHCICDGRSVLNIMHETLRLLAGPDLEIGSYRSFASVQDFIPDAMRNNWFNKFKMALVSAIARPAIGLMAFKKEIKRDRPYLIYWKLDKGPADLLLAKCRSEGVSINAAIAVAFEKAFKNTAGPAAYNKMYCAVDMRKFIPQVTHDMIFAYPSMIDLSLNSCADAPFWQQARFVQQDLYKKMEKMDVTTVLMYSEALMSSLPKMTKYARAEKGVHDFTLSNMGRVPVKEFYNDLEIAAVYPHVTIFPFGNPSTLFSTSFRGQIDFIFTSDEVFIEEAVAVSWRDEAMRLLSDAAL